MFSSDNKLPLIIFGSIGGVIVILLFAYLGVLPGGKPPEPEPAELQVWGVLDDEEAFRSSISGFKEKFKHLTVVYRKLDERTFEDTLVNRLAAGAGPDIFFLKNTQVLRHWNKIAQLPQQALQFSSLDFKRVFVDVAAFNLILGENAVLGLPLYVDTLALFYNKDIFNAAGIAIPPKTWNEVLEVSKKLTRVSPTKDVISSGIALGTSNNVEHAFEILSALMLEKGEGFSDPYRKMVNLGTGAADALAFYTSFSDPQNSNFSWTERMPNSLDAFADGTTAMVIGFSRDLERIKQKNPHLSFDITPFPRSQGVNFPVTFASYYFPTVSSQSRNIEASWQFLLYLAAGEGTAPYLEKSGRPSARRDIIAQGAPKDELDIFYKQALVAKSWHVPNESASRRFFGDAIDSVIRKSQTPLQAINRLRDQLRLLLP